MRISFTRFTIIRTVRPVKKSINEKLQWFGLSLGLFSLRDKDKSSFRIFLELVKAAKTKVGLSSDELAERLGLSRGTVVHHLNNLAEHGLIVGDHNKYMLRVENLEQLVDELKRDMERSCEDLKDVAKEIDNWLKL